MNKLQKCLGGAVCLILGAVYGANADDSATIPVPQQNSAPDYRFYRAQEFSVDVFGSGSVGEQTIEHLSTDRVDHRSRLGVGAGANYFFTRYIGVGADAYSDDTKSHFIDSASGNLILRLPIADTGIAPYAFGGGGYQFDEVSQRFGQAGGGVEFRFCRHLGIFADARYVFADKSENYGLGRAGLRLNF